MHLCGGARFILTFARLLIEPRTATDKGEPSLVVFLALALALDHEALNGPECECEEDNDPHSLSFRG
jgi:hypothetical protein